MGPKKENGHLHHQPYGVYCLQNDIGFNVNRQQIEAAVGESGGSGNVTDVIRVKRSVWVIILNNKHSVEVLSNKGIKINDRKVKIHKGNYAEVRKRVLAGYHPEIQDNPFSDNEDENRAPNPTKLYFYNAKPKEEHRSAVAYWLAESSSCQSRHEQVIKIKCLEPFLFGGRQYQENEWLQYACEVKLLSDATMFTKSEIEEQCFLMLDIMEEAVEQCFKHLRNMESHLLAAFQILRLLSETGTRGDSVDFVAKQAERQGLVEQLTQAVLDANPGCQWSWCQNLVIKSDIVVIALLMVFHHYTSYVLVFWRTKKNPFEEFDKELETLENQSCVDKDAGNKDFKEKRYEPAINKYTKAIELNPFSFKLYSNRAQAYLYMARYKAALCDARRAVVLKPDWSKGHFRYVQAAYDLKEMKAAVALYQAALQHCPKDKTFIMEKVPVEVKEAKSNAEEEDIDKASDGVPSLVSSTDSDHDSDWEDEEEDEEEEVVSKDDMYERLTSELPSAEQVSRLPSAEQASQNIEVVQRQELRKKQIEAEKKIQEQRRKREEKRQKREKREAEEKQKQEEKEKQRKAWEAEQQPEKKEGSQQKEVMKLMREGSEDMRKEVYRQALWRYESAYETMTSKGAEHLFDVISRMVLQYSIATCCVKIGAAKEVQDGINWYNCILNEKGEAPPTFPVVYYGLGRALCIQHRYTLAIIPLQHGLSTINKLLSKRKKSSRAEVLPVYSWPGTDTIIEESQPLVLKSVLLEHIELCQCPPRPDAVCRYVLCSSSESQTTSIYKDEPNFKGYVKVFCFADCRIDFHSQCWKKYKSSSEPKLSNKSILSGSCLTPDCSAAIRKITVVDEGQNDKETINEHYIEKAAKDKKPLLKLKPSDRNEQKKQDKKQERKAKKEARREKKQQDSRETEQKDDIIGAIESMEDNNEEEQEQAKYTVHRRQDDEQEDEKFKVKKAHQGKSKKKKEKSPSTTVPLNIQFKGDSERALVSEKDLDGEDEAALPVSSGGYKFLLPSPAHTASASINDFTQNSRLNSSATPFAVPEEIRRFENMLQNETVPLTNLNTLSLPRTALPSGRKEEEDMKETIYSYFMDFLRVRGPLLLDSPIIRAELHQFPPEPTKLIEEAGGISKFLKQSLNFAMIDNYVCLMSDAVKAREMAMEDRRREASSLHPTPVYPASTAPASTLPAAAVYSSVSAASQPSASSVSALCDFSPIDTTLKKKKLALDGDALSSSPDNSQSPSIDVKDLFKKQVFEVAGKQVDQEEESAHGSQRDTESPYSIASDPCLRRNSTSSVAGSEPELDALKHGKTSAGKADSNSSTPSRFPGVSPPSQSPAKALFPPAKPDLQKKMAGVKNLWNLAPPPSNIPEETESLSKLAGTRWDNVQTGWDKIVTENHENQDLLSNIPLTAAAASFVPRTKSTPSPNYPAHSSLDTIDDFDDFGDSLSQNGAAQVTSTAAYRESKFGAIGSSKEGSPVRVPSIPKFPPVTSYAAQSLINTSSFSTASKSPVFADSASSYTAASQPPPGFAMDGPSKWSNVGRAVGEAIHQDNEGNASSLLFSQNDIWSEHPQSNTSQEIDDAVLSMREKVDNELADETAKWVHSKLQGQPAFDSPELYDNIRSSVRRDFEKNAASARSSSSRHASSASSASPSPFRSSPAEIRQPPPPPPPRPETTEASCMTVSLEELQEFMVLIEEKKRLQEDLEKANALTVSLRTNMTVELRSLKSQLDSYQVECSGLRDEADKARAALAAEKKEKQRKEQEMEAQMHTLRLELDRSKRNDQMLTDQLNEAHKYLQDAKNTEQELSSRLHEADRQVEQRHRESAAEITRWRDQAHENELALAKMRLELEMEKEKYQNLKASTQQRQFMPSDPLPSSMYNHNGGGTSSGIKAEPWPAPATSRNSPSLGLSSVLPPAIPSFPPPSVPALPPGFGVGSRTHAATPPLAASPSPVNFAMAAKTAGRGGGAATLESFESFRPKPRGGVASAIANSSSSQNEEWVHLGPKKKAAKKKPSSFLFIVEQIAGMFTDLSREQIGKYITEFRSANGHLTGLKTNDIINGVAEYILLEQSNKAQVAQPSFPAAQHSGGGGISGIDHFTTGRASSQYQQQQRLLEEEDPCVICHEELYISSQISLKCGHIFHKNCIEKWFREQSTCPTCRVHALLPDEFPPLA